MGVLPRKEPEASVEIPCPIGNDYACFALLSETDVGKMSDAL